MAAREYSVQETSDPARLTPSPKVSVLMVTYNHGDWIAQAIESILAQDDCGGFELIIGEDCSSDRTREIVLAYQAQYPEKIRVLTSAGNVGPAANHARVISAARGEYLAFCEGDDYWCHPGKLAAQVALLSANKEAAVAHADWRRARLQRDGEWKVESTSEHAGLGRKHLEGDLFPVFYFGRILRTCTLMVRSEAMRAYKDDPLSAGTYRFEDTVMCAYFTSRWPVAYWSEVASVYRESPGSLLRSGIESKLRFLRSSLSFDTDARNYFADRKDYPASYRWEVAMGLLLWAIKARDANAAKEALLDIGAHFGPLAFIRSGWRAIRLRLPGVLTRRWRGIRGART